jgi:hypothetical protein
MRPLEAIFWFMIAGGVVAGVLVIIGKVYIYRAEKAARAQWEEEWREIERNFQ